MLIDILKTLSRIFKKNPVGELRNVTGAINASLNNTVLDIDQLNLQYEITTASGRWLDEYGSWFKIPRLSNESDDSYRQRILAVASKPKNTIAALQQTMGTFLNGIAPTSIKIYEPYHNVRKFNSSTFSGPDRYQDDVYMRTAVVDVIVPSPGTITSSARDAMDQARAAGVKLYYTVLYESGILVPDAPDNQTIEYLREVDMLARDVDSSASIYSGSYFPTTRRSGRQQIFTEYTTETNIQVYDGSQILAGSYIIINDYGAYTIDQLSSMGDDMAQAPVESLSLPI